MKPAYGSTKPGPGWGCTRRIPCPPAPPRINPRNRAKLMPETVLQGPGPNSMATPALSTAGPSRPDVMASTALALALCVWAGHYLLLSTLYYFVPDRPSDPQTLLARAVVCVVGVSLCLGIYALLRHRARSR